MKRDWCRRGMIDEVEANLRLAGCGDMPTINAAVRSCLADPCAVPSIEAGTAARSVRPHREGEAAWLYGTSKRVLALFWPPASPSARLRARWSSAGGQAPAPTTRRWFRNLRKPGFTPSTPVYPVAWTGIQAAQAYAGYRLMRADPSPKRTVALSFWAANQLGIGGWSEIFFGRRAPGWGTVASAGLGAAATGLVVAARPVDRTASLLAAPLVAWVAFATLLSEEIWRKNPPSA